MKTQVVPHLKSARRNGGRRELAVGPLGSRAFTLIEILTVIAVIGVLAAILIPAYGQVRQKAQASLSLGNLRQIATGCLGFAAEHKGTLPKAKYFSGKPWPDSDWQHQIGPYAQEVTGLESWASGLYRDPLKSDWSLDPAQAPADRYRISYSMNAFTTSSSAEPRAERLANIAQPSRTWLVGTSGSGHVAVYNKDFLHRRDPAPRYKEGHLVVFCDGGASYVPLKQLAYDLTLANGIQP